MGSLLFLSKIPMIKNGTAHKRHDISPTIFSAIIKPAFYCLGLKPLCKHVDSLALIISQFGKNDNSTPWIHQATRKVFLHP